MTTKPRVKNKCRLNLVLQLFSMLCIISPEGVLHKFRLHLCQRPMYKILVQNINNELNAREVILISVYFT